MAKYSYITDKTHNNRKIQVESAKRDGSGKNIENNYAKQNGNYQSLTAGLSNNFDTKQVMVDESAYNFRPTATMGSVELEVGSPCKVKKIIGGSVAFNQLVRTVKKDGSYEITEDTPNYDIPMFSDLNVPTSSGHKVFASAKLERTISTNDYISVVLWGNNQPVAILEKSNGSSNGYARVVVSVPSGVSIVSQLSFNNYAGKRGFNAGDTMSYSDLSFIDLTQMFGSTIADYIYSLEQANAGSGVAWFKRYFPKEYYAYNSGELVSVKTQGKKITHFNQFAGNITDNPQYIGHYYQNPGNSNWAISPNDTSNCFVISVLPSTTYCLSKTESTALGTIAIICFLDIDKQVIGGDASGYGTNQKTTFTTPSNCYYIRFSVSTSATFNININFHYDGERDGEYEPYNSETYPVDDIELRGIPQLDDNNNLAFDGDEYANDGNVTRKYGIVDLGTLNWTYAEGRFSSNAVGDMDGSLSYVTIPNFVCAKYTSITINQAFDNPDKTIYKYQKQIGIIDSAYTDAQTFKTAMSGVYLVYELATPTDENSIPFTEVQECDNWGTEEWLAPTTDTRPCEVPVGHETDYLPDLKAKLEVAPNTPNENGVYVMEHSASGNIYTLIGAWLADNGYQKVVNADSNIVDSAGLTYTYKKVYKIGNMVFMSIRAKNGTASTITAGTTLFTASGLVSSTTTRVSAYVGTTATAVDINSNGNVEAKADIGSNVDLFLNVSYVI